MCMKKEKCLEMSPKDITSMLLQLHPENKKEKEKGKRKQCCSVVKETGLEVLKLFNLQLHHNNAESNIPSQ